MFTCYQMLFFSVAEGHCLSFFPVSVIKCKCNLREKGLTLTTVQEWSLSCLGSQGCSQGRHGSVAGLLTTRHLHSSLLVTWHLHSGLLATSHLHFWSRGNTKCRTWNYSLHAHAQWLTSSTEPLLPKVPTTFPNSW